VLSRQPLAGWQGVDSGWQTPRHHGFVPGEREVESEPFFRSKHTRRTWAVSKSVGKLGMGARQQTAGRCDPGGSGRAKLVAPGATTRVGEVCSAGRGGEMGWVLGVCVRVRVVCVVPA